MYVGLQLSGKIDKKEWEKTWNECVELLKEFPIKVVNKIKEQSEFGERFTWSDRLTEIDPVDNYERLIFCADSKGCIGAESFQLYKDLDYYIKDALDELNSSKKRFYLEQELPENRDKIYRDDPLEFKVHEVLAGKSCAGLFLGCSYTNGLPYHYAVLAVAMLVETRFPTQSYIYGAFIIDQCKLVIDYCKRKGMKLNLPVCLDPARLWNRLEGLGFKGDKLLEHFVAAFCGDEEVFSNWLFKTSKKIAGAYYSKQLGGRLSPNQFGFIDVAKEVLEGSQSLQFFIDIIKNGYDEDSFPVVELYEMLLSHYVTFSPEDSIIIKAFTKELNTSRSALDDFNKIFIRMQGAPQRINCYIPKNKLENLLLKNFGNITREELCENSDKIIKKCISDVEKLEKLSDDVIENIDEDEIIDVSSLSVDETFEHIVNEVLYKKDRSKCFKEMLEIKKGLRSYEQTKVMFEQSPVEIIEDICKKSIYLKCAISNRIWKLIENTKDKEILLSLLVAVVSVEGKDSIIKCNFILNNPQYWEEFK